MGLRWFSVYWFLRKYNSTWLNMIQCDSTWFNRSFFSLRHGKFIQWLTGIQNLKEYSPWRSFWCRQLFWTEYHVLCVRFSSVSPLLWWGFTAETKLHVSNEREMIEITLTVCLLWFICQTGLLPIGRSLLLWWCSKWKFLSIVFISQNNYEWDRNNSLNDLFYEYIHKYFRKRICIGLIWRLALVDALMLANINVNQ